MKEPISNAVRFYNQIEALVPLQIKLPTADTSPNFSLFLNNLPFKKRQVENISSNFMIQTSKQDEEEEKEEKSERLKKPIVKKSHHSIL